MSKRFCNLEKILELVRTKSTQFQTKYLPKAPVGSRSTFGGTLIAQSLLASLNCVPRDFIPISLHAYFINGGNPTVPITYDVLDLRKGNNFIHKEVKAYQFQKLIFQSMILFSREINVTNGYDHLKQLKPGENDTFIEASLLFEHDVINGEVSRKLKSIKKMNDPMYFEKLRNSFEVEPMEYHFPATFFNNKEDTSHCNYCVELRDECFVEEYDDRETTLITPFNDKRYDYVTFAYLTDSHLLLTLPFFKKLPLYVHDFSVSLDHVIYFHNLPSRHNPIYVSITNSKSKAHKHLMNAEYYDRQTGTIIASVSQEGFVVYDYNKLIKAKL
ncbi:hypothetical protein KAFR_0E01960 [Kazachstania africana CBS 2517]|uniref:Acyl-CoA thioesterase II n=1 Tax=Kazachstania africana (strain ATCC 22294 / BCRC 22015 / CBS 2517 / CECT 1963 / NBRC 1671 / NRRL Y-8276) TaxID=1071382 RepID=H2AVF0_KAZAF|nr:hypothetical protein KAFR_0E01960 [Kazachstania africana CBS 2517]CCF58350.1 hypothetical protein KAFR_0E01960 [Kazachstania africana CBS 2517]